LAVVLNANAKQVTPRVVEGLRRQCPGCEVFVTHDLEEARELGARLAGRADVVAVGGGDGTATHTINLILDHAPDPIPKFGFLRLGTGNALGCLVGAGRVEDDLRLWMNGGASADCLTLVEDGHGFRFPFASVGYDARVLNDHHDLLQSARHPCWRAFLRSSAGYLVAAVTRSVPVELAAPPVRFRVQALGAASFLDPATDEEVPLDPDDVLFDGPARAVTLGTTPFYGYGLRALPFARRRRDRFQVRVTTSPPGRLIRRFGSLWRGTLRCSEIRDYLVEGVRVDCDRPQPVQMAGEARGLRTHLECTLSPQSVTVLRGTRKPLAAILRRGHNVEP
jgi:diacylglycerol kinase family enzyme